MHQQPQHSSLQIHDKRLIECGVVAAFSDHSAFRIARSLLLPRMRYLRDGLSSASGVSVEISISLRCNLSPQRRQWLSQAAVPYPDVVPSSLLLTRVERISMVIVLRW
jgi:hypothetical protein